ncbi:MAG: LamB/YcsF family protein, partial [Saprospiraceae bacterium]|nr:LamB/YcsF family protein [Saprospiraceae bacterium]
MKSIHINCDMAESYGMLKTGDDLSILPFVDAVNIACGFHGGDPLTIETTLRHSIIKGKQIGAHPSFPDLMGFGRRDMLIDHKELAAILRYQICAVKALTENLGGHLHHVKAHGALYNKAVTDAQIAGIFVRVVAEIDPDLIIFAPYGSEMAKCAISKGIKVMNESFGDRKYGLSGHLVDRN